MIDKIDKIAVELTYKYKNNIYTIYKGK